MKETFKYVTYPYYSNCFIECIKAKLHSPTKVKIYFCKPTIANHHFEMFHFMWEDDNYSYDFSDLESYHLKWYQCLLFKGCIRQFDKTFAKRYCAMKNNKITNNLKGV